MRADAPPRPKDKIQLVIDAYEHLITVNYIQGPLTLAQVEEAERKIMEARDQLDDLR